MGEALINACSFAGVIVLAFLARRLGVFGCDARIVVSAAMLSITLPASIIVNLNGAAIGADDVYFLGLGVLANVAALAVGWLCGHRGGRQRAAFFMVSLAGCNVGCFAMPFIAGLLPARAIVQASLFDVGNSLMCLGLNYGIIAQVKEPVARIDWHRMAQSVYGSVPVMTYLVMMGLCVLGIALPVQVMGIADIAAKANPFLAMAAIGTAVELGIRDKTELCHVLLPLFARFVLSLVLAGVALVVLPIPLEARPVAAILFFAPIGAISSVFAYKLELDGAVSAFINSLYIPISIASMSILIGLFI